MEKELTAYLVCGIIGLILIIFSIVLFSGKGGVLIAGYNTSTRKEKEKYDFKKLSKFIGGIMLVIGLLTPASAYGIVNGIKWVSILYPVCVLGLIIFAVLFINLGKAFKK